MYRLLAIVFGIAAATTCYGLVYQWTDANGTVHYSDQPQPGASVVPIKNNEVSVGAPPTKTDLKTTAGAATSPLTVPAASAGSAATTPQVTALPKPHVYTSVKIAKPENQANLWNNGATVDVVVALEPALMEGDKIQLLIDSKPHGEPQTTAILQATGLSRGAHTVQAQVLSVDGKMLGTSASVTFYMHLATVEQTRK